MLFCYSSYASDPREDKGVQRAWASSDAPYWAATEWLLFHDDKNKWMSSLKNTLSSPRCRYVCIFNWNGIIKKDTVHEAIQIVCGNNEL